MTSKPSPRKTEASKPATVLISPHWMRRHREQLDDWLHANGIDPSVVSVDHAIRVEGGVIHFWALDPDVDDAMLAKQSGSEAAAVDLTARCASPPPWLAPGSSQDA